MIDNPEKPDPPAPGECCEGGCSPCVWDIYYESLRYWKEQQAAKAAAMKRRTAENPQRDK